MKGRAQRTYNNIAEHFAVGDVEATVSISLKFDVFYWMFSTISASAATIKHTSVSSSSVLFGIY